jgi:DMSO/TMAO reductase YedYZ molybdopterin-dependent catalytic subunit
MSDAAQPIPPADAEVIRQSRRRTRRSFLTGAVAAAAGFGGWAWLRSREPDDGIPWPLRRVLRFNERLGRALFSDGHLAPTFPAGRAAEPRVNGAIGLQGKLDPAAWRLNVRGPGRRALRLRLEDLKSLPFTESVNELKCIEGWSEVVRWGGVRFRDFAARHVPDRAGGAAGHVRLTTPDGDYYVGLDLASALHPQTLLCWEVNGAPLTPGHGAPLRLVIPSKYGIKNIKRIGLIEFMDDRPADYWAERGYDWYAGL